MWLHKHKLGTHPPTPHIHSYKTVKGSYPLGLNQRKHLHFHVIQHWMWNTYICTCCAANITSHTPYIYALTLIPSWGLALDAEVWCSGWDCTQPENGLYSTLPKQALTGSWEGMQSHAAHIHQTPLAVYLWLLSCKSRVQRALVTTHCIQKRREVLGTTSYGEGNVLATVSIPQ